MHLKLYFPVMCNGVFSYQLFGELFEGFQLESLGWRTASCQLISLNPVLERGKGRELSVEQCPSFVS